MRLCSYPGCYRQTKTFFCPRCQPKIDKRKALLKEANEKEVERSGGETRTPRPSARGRGYSPLWDKISKAYLNKYNLCKHCDLRGKVVEAKEVDHIYCIALGFATIRKKGYQSLCLKCHRRKTAEEHRFMRRNGIQPPLNQPLEGDLLEAYRAEVLLPDQ